MNHYDIVVVGAGLVGASFSALLAQKLQSVKPCISASSPRPLSIALVDHGQAPVSHKHRVQGNEFIDNASAVSCFDPRVVALTQASKSLFSTLGLWQDIQSLRSCAYTNMHVWDDDGTGSIHFSAEDIQEEALGYIVENTLLLSAVLERIEQCSITVLRGVAVNRMVQHNGYTELLGTDGTILSAGLVVAADGGQSAIRALASMPVREWPYEHKAIVATVECEKSHEMTAWQNFLSTGPLAFLPLDHPSERYCSIVWSADNNKADEMMDLTDDDFCSALSRAFEYRLGKVVSVSQRFCFSLNQRHAVDYVSDNIVLIGDAAHTIHPLAGQGVNLGLLDAQALANELVRAFERGLAVNDASVLRRYQRQRKGHNIEVMLLMEALKRLFSHRQLWVRCLRNLGLKSVNEWGLLKNWLAKQAVRND